MDLTWVPDIGEDKAVLVFKELWLSLRWPLEGCAKGVPLFYLTQVGEAAI